MANAKNTDWKSIPISRADLHFAPYHEQVLACNNIQVLGCLIEPDLHFLSTKSGLIPAWIAAYKQEAAAFVRGIRYAMDNLVQQSPATVEGEESKAGGK